MGIGSHQGHDHGAALPRPRRAESALILALVLTGVFVFVEFFAGAIFGSLALTADAVHMLSDTFALGLALVAQIVARRPVSATHSFGWRRIEVLAAFVNGLVLLAISGWIVWEAMRRIGDPVETNATGLMIVAAAGLLINLAAMLILWGASKDNMNVRAAALHTIGDAAGSVGALAAGVVLALGGPQWADPVASVVIATLVATAALRLVRDAARVLMERAPVHIDPEVVADWLSADPSVMRVHHMHVWTLAPGQASMSAHVELRDTETLHEAQSHGVRLKALVAERFGIEHTTFELECHPCDPSNESHKPA